MVSAPSTAAVSVGTAITAASRQRTRQLARANRDRAEAGFLGCGWVARTMLAAGRAPGGVWVVRGAPALPCSPACSPVVTAACPAAACAPVPAASFLPLPAALPAARSPEPPPSACPPLTAPVGSVVSPGFVTDRLRTTFAPRIGRPDQHARRAKTARAAYHTYPSFPTQRSPLLGSTGRPRPHSRVTKRVRTYNHLLDGCHGAFATKPARSSRSRLPRGLTGS